VLELKMKANVPGFGDVWYDPNLKTNIFSFAELNEKHKITFDSTKERAFEVHLRNKIVKFKMTTNGLYLYKPNDYVLRNDIKIARVRDNKQIENKKNENEIKKKNENKRNTKTNYKYNYEEMIEFSNNENENENNNLFEEYE
jgi:hypothetical protein